MNYLLKSSRNTSRFSHRPIGIIFIATLLIALVFVVFPGFFPSIFIPLFAPSWKTDSSQYDALQQRLVALQSAEARIGQLAQENTELKALLGRSSAKDGVLASVIRKPPQSLYDTILIDVGKESGVSVGDTVYALGDVVIGKVSAVYARYAKVTLFSAPGQKYDVVIGQKNIPATAVGRGGDSFEIVLPRDSGVVVGDSVSAPLTSPSILATVGALVAQPAQAFVAVLANSPVSTAELRWVEVDRSSSVFDAIMDINAK